MTRALFDAAFEAARDWHTALPALGAFCDWPDGARFADRPAVAVPAITHLQANPGAATAASQALCTALIDLAPYVEWRHTYTESEVGADFLQRYGWFELIGPDGHYLSDQVRMTIGFWGAGLVYGRHQHLPEELYSVVSGAADFMLDGAETLRLSAGDTRLHPSNQPHALTTTTDPILTFVIWRGDGLADAPRMTKE
ncbi:Cupin domain protein [Roseovarius litorisediminis]|uniref:Cupin domain protein n=1 Tax=Roseovarius litorisediminis TaxID=1312363 RepID=A0A1Y5SHH9_9RHOB|nr:dimethylsulfonioproprionate lyase family protein [Roseovarius litorisediminis]SLN37775.1 Cupin domain protein [Roseovarius litorisediminis]